MTAQVWNQVEKMVDGFTDPLISLIPRHFATKPLIIIGWQYAALALCSLSICINVPVCS